jgi:solute carrier family 25 folate transporter 32
MSQPVAQPSEHSSEISSMPSQRPGSAGAAQSKTRVKLGSNAVAGVFAGFISCVTTHPLDVVKTRFQVQDGRLSHVPLYRGTTHALVTIAKTEGLASLYAGLTPNLLGSTVSWGCYFYGYNYLKGLARANSSNLDSRGQLGPGMNMACATCAGLSTCIATNPIWLVKTRLQLQHGSGRKLNGMVDALKTVVKEEGFLGLYKGLFPSLLLVSHGALQFMCYEEMKKGFQRYVNGGAEHLTTWQTFFTGATAKVFASVVTYPSQVVRARLQQVDPNVVRCQQGQVMQGERYYRGTTDVVVKVLKHEGVHGFYKGIVPNLLRVVPSAAITFVVYEKVAKFLGAKT